MDRLIFKQIDFNHKPVGSAERVAARKAKKAKPPRSADSYRGAKRNDRGHVQRTNPSLGGGYQRPIKLNRSQHWNYAADYYEARDLSQSSREVV